MNSYSDVDGVPAGADHWLLTDLLREEWGFAGSVVSDYWAVPFLAIMHRIAADVDEAGAQALAAGIDVELPDTIGFGPGLVERVRRGELPEALVDRAARRLLTQKVQLGLLDADWTPEGSVAGAAAVDLDSPANRALAREMAERSVVLLEAGSALPLLGDGRPAPRRVAVIGPCAADPRVFMGCYAFPNHVLPRHPGLGLGLEVQTAVDALAAELPGVEIVHQQGCPVQGADRSGFEAALAAARGADLCVALVGDLAGLFGHGSSGEGCDAEDLRLPGVQADLLDELLQTGTPVVVVVVSGRPYALGDVQGRAAGLVQAFMPGEEGGPVIAGVLSGRIQPSGKLPVQIPKRPGGQPRTYLQPPLGGPESAGISTWTRPPLPVRLRRLLHDLRGGCSQDQRCRGAHRRRLHRLRPGPQHGPAGGGRGGPALPARRRRPGRPPGEAARRLRPRRAGARRGRRRDVPGARRPDRLPEPGARAVVEPGDIEVMVGTSAADLPCRGRVRLTGPLRKVGHDRQLITPVELSPVAGDAAA